METWKVQKNRFIARCNYFSNKKNNNSSKSNTSEVNILDENIKNYRYPKSDSINSIRKTKFACNASNETGYPKPFERTEEVYVKSCSAYDRFLSQYNWH